MSSDGYIESTASPDDRSVSESEIQSEIHQYLHVQSQRRRLFPRAALVGLLCGVLATAFRAALALGDNLRIRMLIGAHRAGPLGICIPIIVCAAGVAIAVHIVRRYAPEASGSGIPHLEAVLHRLRDLRWRRIIPVKFLSGMLAMGCGLGLGREGPTVQMGGSIGAAVAAWLKIGERDRLVLIAAGAGAGLAAAFNAPLAGVIFVLEEVQRDFRPAVFGATFLAAAVADIVARFASGQLPVFAIPSYPMPALGALPYFAIAGIAAGVIGLVYSKSLIATLNIYSRIPSRFIVPTAAGIGAVAGIIAWQQPLAVGGGHHLAEVILDGHIALIAIPGWYLLRHIFSQASYGTGASGGIFAPMLGLGALTGLAVGKLAHHLSPGLVPIPAVFAVVGMAAYFTAVVRAPLTGIVLIVEMTGNYSQMLPLLVACFCAYMFSEWAGILPIYETLLERDLMRGGMTMNHAAPFVLELEVEPGSPFDGMRIRDLGLPPGCIVVSCRDGSHEIVPTAEYRLTSHMRVSAMVSPDAPGAISMLRHGCEGA